MEAEEGRARVQQRLDAEKEKRCLHLEVKKEDRRLREEQAREKQRLRDEEWAKADALRVQRNQAAAEEKRLLAEK
jgi:hypothetical protein